LIWVHWQQGAQLLYQRLASMKVNVGIATGAEKNVEETVEAYKRGDIDVLILSLNVGRFGHHLINTNTVIYVDRSFDGDAYYQSLHRIKRFGLDHSPVVYTLRVPNSVETMVEENLAGKLETVAYITNGDLLQLLKSLGR
jgi:SNF2 family DNA or RNA helicase